MLRISSTLWNVSGIIILIALLSIAEFGYSFSGAHSRKARRDGSFSFEGKLVDTAAPLVRSAGSSQLFGQSVAVSEDQSTLVIGAPQDNFDSSGSNSLSQAGAVLVYVKSGSEWILQQRLSATGTNARLASDYFGYSVAISGDTIAVGAYGQDYDASGANQVLQSGAVYVFTRSGGVWTQQQKIVSQGTNGRVASDYFGFSVAISGDTIVSGAYQQDYDAAGANLLTSSGAAFVFTRSGSVWTQQQKLVGEGTNGRIASDYFGYSVAISGDTIVAGAYGQDWDEAGANSISSGGAAFVFTRSGSVWSQQQKLVGTGTNARLANDFFGENVSISGDTIVAGANGQDYDASGAGYLAGAGAAFVFTRSGAVWSQQQKLVGVGTNGRLSGDGFGDAVSVSGNSVIVSASAQNFDGNGANSVGGTGASFIFTRSGSTWTIQQKIAGVGTNARVLNDGSGLDSVAISGDTLVIGAPLQDYSKDGDDYIMSAGAAFVNERSGSVWSQTVKLSDSSTQPPRTLSATANLGVSVAISEDKSTMVIGANLEDYDVAGANGLTNPGAAYVYIKSGANWVLQQKLVGVGTNGRIANDNFGISVSISGNTLVVGADGQNYNATGAGVASSAGAAYVFTRTAGVWSLQQKLVGEGTNGRVAGDNFGGSVAIDGDTIVAGATGQDWDESGANTISAGGAAYVFTRSGSTWTQQQKLVGTGTNGRIAADNFGTSVDISGNTIVVGVPGQDWDASGANSVNAAGAAFVYTRSGSVWSQEQKLVGSGTNGRVASDAFGTSVAVDGDTIVIGADGQDYDASGANLVSGAGAAYVLTRSGSVWTHQKKLVGTGTNGRIAADTFGGSVAISGSTILVGATGQDWDAAGANSVSNAGAAFVFTGSGSSWSFKQKLVGMGTNGRIATDNFGNSVAISGNRLVIGAYLQDYDAAGANLVGGAGAAFVYSKP